MVIHLELGKEILLLNYNLLHLAAKRPPFGNLGASQLFLHRESFLDWLVHHSLLHQPFQVLCDLLLLAVEFLPELLLLGQRILKFKLLLHLGLLELVIELGDHGGPVVHLAHDHLGACFNADNVVNIVALGVVLLVHVGCVPERPV